MTLLSSAPAAAPAAAAGSDAEAGRREDANVADGGHRTGERSRELKEDTARVRRVVREQFAALWRYFRRQGFSGAEAEDGAQQVFIVFARRLPEIAPAADRSFLFATALHVARDMRKSRSRRVEVVDALELARAIDPGLEAGALLDDVRARRLLDGLLERLPDDLRDVLVMCDIEELTMAQSAVALEVPAGTVASRLRRARVRFAELLEEVRQYFDAEPAFGEDGLAAKIQVRRVP